MVKDVFTKAELKLLSGIIASSIEQAEMSEIPLRGSALSPKMKEALSAVVSNKLLTLYSIRCKIDLLSEEGES